MAAAYEEVPVTKCEICLENLRNPCRLPCMHLFCKECLESWISDPDNTDSLICPICKKCTSISSEGVHALVQIGMADKVKIDYTQKLCSKCTTSSDKKATVYCQNCSAYLCRACCDSHQTWSDLKHHVIVTIEDLTSGKVQITKMEDQMCTKHEGKRKKFYCGTCKQLVCRDCILMKQHCRDHEYVTLKEAAEEKVSAVKGAMKECDDKRKECQDIILKTEAISSKLNKACEIAKNGNDILKTFHVKQVERFYANQNDDVDKLCDLEDTKLTEATKCSKKNLEQIERGRSQGQALVKSESHYNILANSKSVLETLQQVNQMTLDEVDASLVKFPASFAMGEVNQPWKQIEGFKVDCKINLSSIAVSSDGKVAVCDWSLGVKVLSQSGNLLHTFDDQLGGYGDICIAYDDTYLCPLKSQSAIKHKSNFQVISKFKTVDANKNPSDPWAVTVDKIGCMIFGMKDNAISIHNPDGSLKCSYAIPYKPSSVAVTSNAEVVVASLDNRSVELFDYSGNCLHTLDPPDDVPSWYPQYVCCSTTDEVFVVNRVDPKGIYRYIAGRVSMGCVTRDVDDPYGIALSHDDQILYVTESGEKMVKIFQRP